MKNVSANTDELHMAGAQISAWRTVTTEVFDSAHAAIESAVTSGWVGESALAMSKTVAVMQASANNVTTRMQSHATHMHSTANSYTATELDSAERIDEAGPSNSGGSLLNL